MTNKRTLTPYEKNQLLKYDIQFNKLVDSEIPVEYLTNHVDFYNLNFFVNQNTLIPRIETEELVDLALKTTKKIYQQTKKQVKIVDVGTGSGAIIISLTNQLKKLKIPYLATALDISTHALKIAELNQAKINSQLRINFIKSNLLSNISRPQHLIIANLPYIPSQRIKLLDNSVKDFEPHLALDGGKDGLKLISTLIKQATNLTTVNNYLLLEVDSSHDQRVLESNIDLSNWKIKIIKSKYSNTKFVILKKIK